ncbi:hypothetical protein MYU51_021139 [Penicillium brevicompactum]
MTTSTARREPHSQYSSDPLQCPIAQRGFLYDDATSVNTPMQDIYRATEPSSVASTPSIILSPRFTPVSDFAYGPTLSNRSPEDGLVIPSNDKGHVCSAAMELDEAGDPLAESQPASWTFQGPWVDDMSIEDKPSRYVDYRLHDWKEEDIWCSWRPKECDTTWLYGPLKSPDERGSSPSPSSGLETLNSYCQENGDQRRINPNGTSKILEDSIPGILEGILTPSSPVVRKQESTLFF